MMKKVNETNVQIMDINEMKALNGGVAWNEVGYGVAPVVAAAGGLTAGIAAAPALIIGGAVVCLGGLIFCVVSVGATIVKSFK